MSNDKETKNEVMEVSLYGLQVEYNDYKLSLITQSLLLMTRL